MVQAARKTYFTKPDFVLVAAAQEFQNAENTVFTGFFWSDCYTNLCIKMLVLIDPCMGSGHILVYAFDVLMQIYEASGYTQREAAKSILENNLYGLDIDDRAFQLAYFAVMMKARQYNRRILNGEADCHVYSIQESNTVNRNHLKYLGAGMDELERNNALNQLTDLLDTFVDAKEYGSILNVEDCDWELLRRFVAQSDDGGQMSLDSFGLEDTREQLRGLLDIGQAMAQKYETVVTNERDIIGQNTKNVDFMRVSGIRSLIFLPQTA